jgi:hypothetical protein
MSTELNNLAFYITTEEHFITVQKALFQQGFKWIGEAPGEFWIPSGVRFRHITARNGMLYSFGSQSRSVFLRDINATGDNEATIEEVVSYNIKTIDTVNIDGKTYLKSDVEAALANVKPL